MTGPSGGTTGTDEAAPEARSWGRWFGRPGRSLTRRLIWLASLWIVLALILAGWALTSQYQESALRRLGTAGTSPRGGGWCCKGRHVGGSAQGLSSFPPWTTRSAVYSKGVFWVLKP